MLCILIFAFLLRYADIMRFPLHVDEGNYLNSTGNSYSSYIKLKVDNYHSFLHVLVVKYCTNNIFKGKNNKLSVRFDQIVLGSLLVVVFIIGFYSITKSITYSLLGSMIIASHPLLVAYSRIGWSQMSALCIYSIYYFYGYRIISSSDENTKGITIIIKYLILSLILFISLGFHENTIWFVFGNMLFLIYQIIVNKHKFYIKYLILYPIHLLIPVLYVYFVSYKIVNTQGSKAFNILFGFNVISNLRMLAENIYNNSFWMQITIPLILLFILSFIIAFVYKNSIQRKEQLFASYTIFQIIAYLPSITILSTNFLPRLWLPICFLLLIFSIYGIYIFHYKYKKSSLMICVLLVIYYIYINLGLFFVDKINIPHRKSFFHFLTLETKDCQDILTKAIKQNNDINLYVGVLYDPALIYYIQDIGYKPVFGMKEILHVKPKSVVLENYILPIDANLKEFNSIYYKIADNGMNSVYKRDGLDLNIVSSNNIIKDSEGFLRINNINKNGTLLLNCKIDKSKNKHYIYNLHIAGVIMCKKNMLDIEISNDNLNYYKIYRVYGDDNLYNINKSINISKYITSNGVLYFKINMYLNKNTKSIYDVRINNYWINGE